MNPRAGDTVTSTKATTSTTNTTTNLTTTGELLATLTRKRRQQQQQQRQPRRSEVASKPHPEIKPPPVQPRRRAAGVSETTERTPSTSRLGDFFSTLASRIRKPKHSEGTMDRPIGRLDNCSSPQLSMKRDGNELVEDAQVEGNKRRKIEAGKCVSRRSLTDQSSNGALPKSVRLVEQPRRASAASSEHGNARDIEQSKDGAWQQPSSVQLEESPAANVQSENKAVEEGEESAKSAIVRENGASTTDDSDESKENVSESIERRCSSLTVNLSREQIVESSVDLAKVGASTSRDKESDVGSCSSQPSLRSMMKSVRRNDDTTRLRKTIQWLEEGARRLREDLASARSELYEERRAAKLARRELDGAVKEARNLEATKYVGIVAELKARLAKSPSRSASDSQASSSKTDILKDENHRREVAALKKRLAEAESTIQRLKTNSLDRGRVRKKIKEDEIGKGENAEIRKLVAEAQSLRAINKKLEDRVQIAEESARARAAELRSQHETHEVELATLQKTLRSDTIKLIDEIQSKNREIDKLEKLLNECTQINQRLRAKEDKTMRKLRESERNQQLRLAARIEEKIHHDEQAVDSCKADCQEDEEEVAATELDRLRELAIEQQGVIEVLRQAVKEKERKLEQLSNKRRKEEFYKQWLELEPVAEVDDEDEQQQPEDGGDSALSSAPSSLSPQPNGHNALLAGGVTREAYESVLLEIEETQTKLFEERQQLAHARSHVHELEKALLQETRGSQSSRRTLCEKLRIAEEREASLVAEISELREQNELLEFRVLELEESPNLRNTPDPADSGIVSPEPIHLYKEHATSKHRDRAVATVIPYSSSYNQPVLVAEAQKGPLSLQESGIFEDENEEEGSDGAEDQASGDASSGISGISGLSGASESGSTPRLSSQATQTEAPASELLQEVQRLQELRTRIQERAASSKLPLAAALLSEYKSEAAEGCEGCDAADERICELEERLSRHESERSLSKQREEELLDENYRLAEKTYWLAAEARILREKLECMVASRDAETMTEAASRAECSAQTDGPAGAQRCEAGARGPGEPTAPRPCPSCSELWQSCEAKVRGLAGTESRLRRQVAGLEQREAACLETLRQADATWARLEADYEARQREMAERLSGQLELNRALFEHLTSLNKGFETSSPTCSPTCSSTFSQARVPERDWAQLEATSKSDCASLASSDSCASRLSTVSRTSIRMPGSVGCDQVDTSEPCGMPVRSPTEVAIEAKEEEKEETASALKINAFEDQHPERQPPESHVYIDDSSGEKKQIIYFRWR